MTVSSDAGLVLRRRGLTPQEWLVLCSLAHGCLSYADIILHAVIRGKENHFGPVSHYEAEVALRRLMSRHLIEKITLPIRVSLNEKHGIPMLGLPRIGEFDFTPEGAELFLNCFEEMHTMPYWCEAVIESRGYVTIMTNTSLRMNYIYQVFRSKYPRLGISCRPIGAWRPHWWLKAKDGYMVQFFNIDAC